MNKKTYSFPELFFNKLKTIITSIITFYLINNNKVIYSFIHFQFKWF